MGRKLAAGIFILLSLASAVALYLWQNQGRPLAWRGLACPQLVLPFHELSENGVFILVSQTRELDLKVVERKGTSAEALKAVHALRQQVFSPYVPSLAPYAGPASSEIDCAKENLPKEFQDSSHTHKQGFISVLDEQKHPAGCHGEVRAFQKLRVILTCPNETYYEIQATVPFAEALRLDSLFECFSCQQMAQAPALNP